MKLLFSFLFLSFLLPSSLFCSQLININFKDLDINELIKITSKEIKKNILVTNKIEGKLDFLSSSAIKKESLLDILKYTLKSKGYKIVQSKEILRVVKIDPKEENIELPKKEKKTDKIKNHCEILFLENIDAKNVEKVLNKIIEKRVYEKFSKPTVAVNEELNSIVLDGNLEEIENLKEFIKKLDIEKKQVYVKALIVELDNDLIEDIGIKFGILGGKSYSGGLYTFSSNLNGGEAIAINTSSIGLEIPNVTSTLALGASLNLLNKTYGLDIISEPSILCINNKASSIYVGETISIQTGTTVTDGGNTTNSYEREDVGLTLNVKPRVSKNNKVYLEVTTLVENIKNRDNTYFNPDTSKKEIKTQAILNNGESVIIGGLMEKKNEKTVQKVPFAGDIPLIGELFKNRSENSQNKNLVVVITPYIIPENRDLTYVRKELSKLKSLEDQFLEKVLIKLKKRKTKKVENKNETLSSKTLHKEMIKEYFGI